MNHFSRVLSAVAALVLLLTGGGFAIPAALADTSATVSVTASVGIEPSLSISVCDDSADFGSHLTNDGAAPTGADFGVFATTEGAEAGQGVFYVWSNGCSPGIHLGGNVPFSLRACATENAGATASPNVSVGQQDLRFLFTAPTTYEEWLDHSFYFTVCPSPLFVGNYNGEFDLPLHLALRIDDGDANGDFTSVATFRVDPS